MSQKRLSKNQQKILELLEQQSELKTIMIAELIFGRVVKYRSKEYGSIHRSLRSLKKRGLVERVNGWRLRKTQ